LKKELPSLLYLIQDTDLTDFAYKLHVLPGDFLRECPFNMHTLSIGNPVDHIAVMGHLHIWLDDAPFAYLTGSNLHQTIQTIRYPASRAFLFHTDRMEGGRSYGEVLVMDLDTLRADVNGHRIEPVGVSTVDENGTRKELSFAQWRAMELYEKDALKQWGYLYRPEDMAVHRQHYREFVEGWEPDAIHITADGLFERLNFGYMEDALNAQLDMCRIPQVTAKQMLLSGEAPVYRLLPSGPDPIPPIAVVKNGLWYCDFREFAIRQDDMPALDRLCRKETDKLLGIRPEHTVQEKPRPAQER